MYHSRVLKRGFGFCFSIFIIRLNAQNLVTISVLVTGHRTVQETGGGSPADLPCIMFFFPFFFGNCVVFICYRERHQSQELSEARSLELVSV